MKKILIFFVAVVISIVTFGQVRSNLWTMPDYSTNFPIALPAYSTVTVESDDKVYLVTSYYTTAQTMTHVLADVNYVEMTGGGSSPWTESGSSVSPTTATNIISDSLELGSDADNVSGFLRMIASDGDRVDVSINTSRLLTFGVVYGVVFGDAMVVGTNKRAFAGGYGHVLSEDYTTAFGYRAKSVLYGQLSQSAFVLGSTGTISQTSTLTAGTDTTHSAATWFPLYLDGASFEITIPSSSVWTFEITIAGTDDAQSKTFSYKILGQLESDAAGTETINAQSVTTIYETDSDFDARVQMSGDNFQIQVQDATSGGDKIRWVARAELTQVEF